MVGWIILGVIVLLLFVINMIRIGADIAYEGGIFRLSAKAAGILIQIIPEEEKDGKKKKKEKKPKKKKEKKEKEPAKEESNKEEKEKKKGLPLGMNLDELLEAVKKVLQRIARFPRKFLIERFKLNLIIACRDPYDTAMTYGYINEALSILIPLARQGFKVRKSEISTDVDFLGEKTQIDFSMALTIRIGQIVGFLFSLIFAAVGVVIKSKRRQKKEKKLAKKAGETEEKTETETDQVYQTVNEEKNGESDKEINLPEERTDSNG